MKKRVGMIISIIGIILAVGGITYKVKKSMSAAISFSIIGKADGPTSIFLAGKVGDGIPLAVAVIGIILLLIGIGIYVKGKRE